MNEKLSANDRAVKVLADWEEQGQCAPYRVLIAEAIEEAEQAVEARMREETEKEKAEAITKAKAEEMERWKGELKSILEEANKALGNDSPRLYIPENSGGIRTAITTFAEIIRDAAAIRRGGGDG